jgi:hypothetical protein
MKNLGNAICIKRILPKSSNKDFIFPIQYIETDTINGEWAIEITHLDQPVI